MLRCDDYLHVKRATNLILERSLVTVVQKMRHPILEIEDHLAKHAIGPAEPVHIVSSHSCVRLTKFC